VTDEGDDLLETTNVSRSSPSRS